jgi:hypothetical protein
MDTLLDAARVFHQTGAAEVEAGLLAGDQVKVRDGAEKAWNAIVQATDYAMQRRGRTPMPGRDAHRDRRNFLEQIGRWDLAQKYAYLSERLHGDVFYAGERLPAETLRRYLNEVRDYLDKIAEL